MASKKAGSVLNFLDNLAASTATATPAKQASAPSDVPPADMVVALDDIGIDPERKQPRRKFDQEALNRLAEAIKEHGLIQPIVVRHSGVASPKYYLIAGERRWRSCRIAEKNEVPIYLRDDLSSNAHKQYEVQVIENGNRQSLTDYEFACGLREMIANRKAENPGERGVKGKVAALAGVSASDLSRYLSLLDDDIEPLASEGIIYNSEHVSMFRKLPDDVRDALVASARERGEPIAWSELRDALAAQADVAREAQADAGGSAAPATDPHADASTSPQGDSQPSTGDHVANDGQSSTDSSTVDAVDVHTDHAGSAVDGANGEQGGEAGSDWETPGGAGDGVGSTAGHVGGSSGTSSDAAGKAIKLSKLSGEKVEMLLRFLVDKETDKLDVTLPRDLAVAVLENMGIELPESVEDYATRIKDFLV
jgi:ParB/RepB/Spo0J family partition protein